MTRRFSTSEARPASRILLIAGVLGLVLLNWRLLTAEIDISPIAPGQASDVRTVASIGGLPAEGGEAAPNAYPQMLARPLFRTSRRPPEQAEADARPQAAPRQAAQLPENLELVGIMKEGSRGGRALIRVDEGSPGQWMEVGHVLQGWRLSRIDGASIAFEAEGHEQRLSLFPARRETNQ